MYICLSATVNKFISITLKRSNFLWDFKIINSEIISVDPSSILSYSKVSDSWLHCWTLESLNISQAKEKQYENGNKKWSISFWKITVLVIYKILNLSLYSSVCFLWEFFIPEACWFFFHDLLWTENVTSVQSTCQRLSLLFLLPFFFSLF